MTLHVVDLEISNLRSVLRALERIGVPARVTTNPDDLDDAPCVMVPGVGSFRDGMQSLATKGLVEPLRAYARAGRPLIGICLGMQLLADSGEEHGEHEGLGLIPGRARKLSQGQGFRVPNIGWSEVTVTRPSWGFPDGLDGTSFYFVHSFHLECRAPADVVATIEHAQGPVAAVVTRDRVLGMQFHPEKSQDAGLTLLRHVAESALGRSKLGPAGMSAVSS